MKITRRYFSQLLLATLIYSCLTQAKAMPEANPFQGATDSQTCAACHGPNGNTDVSAWPKLAGQHMSYLIKQLQDYQQGMNGPRPNEIMHGQSITLNKQQLIDISAYFAQQITDIGSMTPEDVARAEQLYRGGDIQKGIPACMSCHGPSGQGIGSAKIPKLSGQNPEYTYQQLQAFKAGTRKNDPNDMMQDVAMKLSDEDMRILANYLFGLH